MGFLIELEDAYRSPAVDGWHSVVSQEAEELPLPDTSERSEFGSWVLSFVCPLLYCPCRPLACVTVKVFDDNIGEKCVDAQSRLFTLWWG